MTKGVETIHHKDNETGGTGKNNFDSKSCRRIRERCAMKANR